MLNDNAESVVILEIDKPQIPTVRNAIDQLRSRMNVGRLVVKYRVQRGLTQQALAEIAGTKQGRISEIETLEGNATFETLDKISFALGLEVTLQPRSLHVTPGDISPC